MYIYIIYLYFVLGNKCCFFPAILATGYHIISKDLWGRKTLGGSLTQKFKFHRGYNDEKPTMAKNIHTHTSNVYITRTFGRVYYFLFSFQFFSFVCLPDIITKKKPQEWRLWNNWFFVFVCVFHPLREPTLCCSNQLYNNFLGKTINLRININLNKQ